MAGPKQIWPGAAMRRFFAALLARETRLPEAERERLAEALAKPIGRLLVYHDPSDSAVVAALPAEPAAPAAQVITEIQTAAPPPAAFDPFAFSVVAVLKRSGKAALLERLSQIGEADHLHRLADAQHLALEPATGDLDDLRHAIVAGAEARLAERRAAAS